MRLFIAIELPEDLKRTLGRLGTDIPEARRVPTEQMHLTLAFLDEVEEEVVERLAVQLARIREPEFQLSFSSHGCFPDRRRARVLWIGVEPHRRLLHLACAVREAVLACGIQQEERPFSPHITLARLKLPPSRGLDTFLDQPRRRALPPFRVQAFTLFQSRLAPQGAVHVPLRRFALEDSGKI